jgi:tetratricopeptide (TPR) repeat protein
MSGVGDVAAAAQAAYDAREFLSCRKLALEALVENPADPHLLRLAGRSSLELYLDDAVTHLRAVTELEPDDAAAWRDLGLASYEEGDIEGAGAAFRRAHDLDPSDEVAVLYLTHAFKAAGEHGQAIELLQRSAATDDASPEVLRTLAAMASDSGDAAAALQATEQLLAQNPKDVGAMLARAELHLALGHLDEAARAFAALRSIDDDDGHESFACHGQAEALLLARRWRAALDVAIEATRLDRLQLTTDILRYASAKLFGEADRSAPPWEEIQAALAEERAAHARMHAEQEML